MLFAMETAQISNKKMDLQQENSVKFPREQSNQCELLATGIASLARRMECLGGGG